MSDQPQTGLEIRIRLPLDRFDLEVDFSSQTQVMGVFGSSGAGKTSLLETVAGLRRQAQGRIRLGAELWFDSSSGTFLRPEERHIGYVPQDGLLFPHRNVRRNLLSGAARARRNGGRLEDTFASVCRLLELEPLLQRPVTTLSGGERKRVALGRALCSGPRLLLMDEPLASLDLPLRRRVLPFLRRVRREFRTPTLLVSHDPAEIQALCDELIVLHEGHVIARGSPRQVLTDPKIFPLAEEAGFENLLPGVLISTQGATSQVRLGESESPLQLTAPKSTAQVGDDLMVGIPAHEIIIATDHPQGLSARNILPAKITSIEDLVGLRLVRAALGPDLPDLAIQVTSQAMSGLELRPGKPVHLIIKATGCSIYSGRGEQGQTPPSKAAG
ncbi:MAG TPA: molybdenum ABC transporter ATP-binding protein [Acidobacteriota bacterium]|nr:molybdenum ABC transporter ATP-binding protein [Acidobacteriota bacterium]